MHCLSTNCYHALLLMIITTLQSCYTDIQKTTAIGHVQLDAEMKDLTRYEGETLRIKCEISGVPLPMYVWRKDGVVLGGSRQKAKSEKYSAKPTMWGSKLRISKTTVHDSGVYSCEGSNQFGRQFTNATLTILPASMDVCSFSRNPNPDRSHNGEGLGDNTDGLGVDDLDDQFDLYEDRMNGRGTPRRPGSDSRDEIMDYVDLSNTWDMTDDRRSQASCEPYRGSACAKYLGRQDVLVPGSIQQSLLEEQITAILTAIASMPSMSEECQRFAVPALCHYIYPTCQQPQYPSSSRDTAGSSPRGSKRLCRQDCRILQNDICRKEYQDLGKLTIMDVQMLTPNCSQLVDDVGSCIQLGVKSSFSGNSDLLKSKQSCYNGTGKTYKGTEHVSTFGKECLPWSSSQDYGKLLSSAELSDWKNYCRNPNEELIGPWCYTSYRPPVRELCPVQKCVVVDGADDSSQKILSILIPCLAVPACIILIVVIVQMAKRCRRGANTHTKIQSNNHQLELSAMLVKTPPKITEIPISSVCFAQELGTSSYGKVYRGEVVNYAQSTVIPVAIKTLRPDCSQKKRSEFWFEAEKMADIKHSSVLCLIGACKSDRPESLLYEYSVFGDLHEYLIAHSPNSDIAFSDISGNQQILRNSDMIHIAVQISSGMDFLSSRGIVHGDLAARNILVSESMTLKISDLEISRNSYPGDYYMLRGQEESMPVRWMPAEAIRTGKLKTDTDIWSFGVTLWEVQSYGLQPYIGCTNDGVIEMIYAHEILPCPAECPSRMYSLMVECWHKTPSCRPSFSEVHRKLRQWWGDGGLTVGHSSSHSGGSQHSGHPGENCSIMFPGHNSTVAAPISTSIPLATHSIGDMQNIQRQRSIHGPQPGYRNGGINGNGRDFTRQDSYTGNGQYIDNGNKFILNQPNGMYCPYSGKEIQYQKPPIDHPYTPIHPYQTMQQFNGNHVNGSFNKRSSSPPRSVTSHKSST